MARATAAIPVAESIDLLDKHNAAEPDAARDYRETLAQEDDGEDSGDEGAFGTASSPRRDEPRPQSPGGGGGTTEADGDDEFGLDDLPEDADELFEPADGGAGGAGAPSLPRSGPAVVHMHVPRDCKLKVVGENNADRLMWACSRLAKDRGEYLSLVAARENENDPNHKRTVLACRYVVFLASYRRMGYNKPKRKQEALRFLETWHPERGAYSEELAIQRRIAGISFSNGDSEDVRNAAIHLGDWAADILRKHEAEVAAAVAHDAAQHAEAVARRARADASYARLWAAIREGQTTGSSARGQGKPIKRAHHNRPADPAAAEAKRVAKQSVDARAEQVALRMRNARYEETLQRTRDAKARADQLEQQEIAEARAEIARRREKKLNAQLKKQLAEAKSAARAVAKETEELATDVFASKSFFAGLSLGQMASRWTRAKAREKTRSTERKRAREAFYAELGEDELRDVHIELLPGESIEVVPPAPRCAFDAEPSAPVLPVK